MMFPLRQAPEALVLVVLIFSFMQCLHYEVQYCKEMHKLAQSRDSEAVSLWSLLSGGFSVATQHRAAHLGLAAVYVSFVTHGLTSELAACLL